MTTLLNNFSGGTNGTTLTPGNSGGASGNAFDSVLVSGTSTLKYDNTNTIHSGLSAKSVNGAATANSIMEWTTSLGGSLAQVWFRAYLYITAAPPSGNARFFDARQDPTVAGSVAISAAGKIAAQDSATVTQATSTTTLPLNAWFRIEGYVIGSATVGQIQAKIFTSPDAVSPVETVTTAATINTTGTINRVDYGNPSSAANFAFWLGDVGVSSTGYIGPVVTATAPRSASIVPQLIAAGVLP